MVTLSRIELLKQKQLLNRAELGIELLEERLMSLMEEFKQLVKEIAINYDELAEYDHYALELLGQAMASDPSMVEYVAKDREKDIRITVEKTRVFGMQIAKLPNISYQQSIENFPISISSAIPMAAKQFRQLYFSYLNYIEQVIVLHQVGNEIRRTRRQIMVLENDIVPELRMIIKRINLVLEEHEREEQVRLRRFKQFKGRE